MKNVIFLVKDNIVQQRYRCYSLKRELLNKPSYIINGIQLCQKTVTKEQENDTDYFLF